MKLLISAKKIKSDSIFLDLGEHRLSQAVAPTRAIIGNIYICIAFQLIDDNKIK